MAAWSARVPSIGNSIAYSLCSDARFKMVLEFFGGGRLFVIEMYGSPLIQKLGRREAEGLIISSSCSLGRQSWIDPSLSRRWGGVWRISPSPGPRGHAQAFFSCVCPSSLCIQGSVQDELLNSDHP